MYIVDDLWIIKIIYWRFCKNGFSQMWNKMLQTIDHYHKMLGDLSHGPQLKLLLPKKTFGYPASVNILRTHFAWGISICIVSYSSIFHAHRIKLKVLELQTIVRSHFLDLPSYLIFYHDPLFIKLGEYVIFDFEKMYPNLPTEIIYDTQKILIVIQRIWDIWGIPKINL